MRRTGLGPGGIAIVVLLMSIALLVGFPAPTLALTASPTDLGSPVAQQGTPTPTPTNNTTVQHERPDNVSESGDAQVVSQWLAGRLGERLQGSAIELSQGEYEQARVYLGDEYDSRLEQYVDVAGETEGTADDQTAEVFRETQTEQQAYANATQSYQDTYDEYQQARRQGNTTAARAAARELETTSQRVTTLNESLHRNYESLENQTGTDTGTARRAIVNTTRNITAQQATVRTQTFIETRLTIETNGSSVAFNDPMRFSGRLRTVNGSALANETVRIGVFERIYEVQTDASGSFSLVYRPVALPVNATTVAVRYMPAITSPYLGTETNASVNVEQVSPSLDVSLSRSQAGYSDTVETTAVATVDGQPVPSLPIESGLGGVGAAAVTNDAGQTTLDQQVPATVSTGEHAVRITHGREGRAVGPAITSVPITITSTATMLTVDAEASGETVTVSGRLRTTGGAGLADQSVIIAVGETVRSTVTTQGGWYQLRLTNASTAGVHNHSAVPVTARFDGTGTNLDSSRAETTVALPTSGDGAGRDSILPSMRGANVDAGLLPPIPLVVAAILGVLGLVGAIAWVRRDIASDESTATATPVSTESATRAETADRSQRLLDRARSALETGDAEHAAMAAYASVRHRLQGRPELPESLTHREFLAACERHAEDVDVAALSSLADAYERATFAGTLEAASASGAVEAAATVLSSDDESS